MPVIMLAGIERGSATAANRSASHYRRRRALFIDPQQPLKYARHPSDFVQQTAVHFPATRAICSVDASRVPVQLHALAGRERTHAHDKQVYCLDAKHKKSYR
ncbi:hypothetical protein SAMN05446635_0614 [Burkholderia sp. OK233]|nr:hypothetical protein SAMN05446635_0614 [Burkholderia sp. OK233]